VGNSTSANQLFKDSILLHQSRLLSQANNYIPKIAMADVNNPSIKSIMDEFEIK